MSLMSPAPVPVEPAEIQQLDEMLKEIPRHTEREQAREKSPTWRRIQKAGHRVGKRISKFKDPGANVSPMQALEHLVPADDWDRYRAYSLPTLTNAMGRDMDHQSWQEYNTAVSGMDPSLIRGFTETLANVITFERRLDSGPSKPSMEHIVATTSRYYSRTLEIVPEEYHGQWTNDILPEATRVQHEFRPILLMDPGEHKWTHAAQNFSDLMGEVDSPVMAGPTVSQDDMGPLPGEVKAGLAGKVVPALIRCGLIKSPGGFSQHSKGSSKQIDQASGHHAGFREVAGLLRNSQGEWPPAEDIYTFTSGFSSFIDEGGFRAEKVGRDYQWKSLHDLLGKLPPEERSESLGGSLSELARTGIFSCEEGWARVDFLTGNVGGIADRSNFLTGLAGRIDAGRLSDRISRVGYIQTVA